MFYSVVLLDGNELHCLSLEEVQILFSKRQINQDSLICSAEDDRWQMLKRFFDLSQWVPAGVSSKLGEQYDPAPNDPFASPPNLSTVAQTTATPPPPVTFNQFPPNQPTQTTNPFASNVSNGYSQNNQTETYYQAETNHSNYNFQNNQSNFAPSKYSNAGVGYEYAANYPLNSTNPSQRRRGLGVAAFFLFVNALFYVAFIIFGSTAADAFSEGGSEAFNSGRKAGVFLPLIINLLLALKLWKLGEGESARKWGLALSYFFLVVFSILVPVFIFMAGESIAGIYVLISSLFYFASLAFLLHGKENPPQSRMVMGIGSFAIYFLIVFGLAGIAVVGKLAPNIAKLNFKNAQLEKYKIDGTEFEDKTTGAKVVLPEGWSMINLDNPVARSPEARMIAVDKAGKRLTMFEIVPVPGNLDMKRQNSSFILDQLADAVVEGMKAEIEKTGGFGNDSAKEITRLSIYVGKHPAKLLVFEQTTGGEKAKGHLIITYDELTFYVLHSWCPAEDYEQAQSDFNFFEKNFTVPEKINSAFTQTAENDKQR